MDIRTCRVCNVDFDREIMKKKGKCCQQCINKNRMDAYHNRQKLDPEYMKRARVRANDTYQSLDVEEKIELLKGKKERYDNNREEILSRKRTDANRAKAREQIKIWRENNKELVAEYKRTHRDHYREWVRLWRMNNKDKTSYYVSKRRAAKLNAIPKWLTPEELNHIKTIYKECSEITKTSGIKHNVDHLYPLQGTYSCGLHVPWNLQIITEEENLKKGNKIINLPLSCD